MTDFFKQYKYYECYRLIYFNVHIFHKNVPDLVQKIDNNLFVLDKYILPLNKITISKYQYNYYLKKSLEIYAK